MLSTEPCITGAIIDFVTFAGDGEAFRCQQAFVPPNPFALRIKWGLNPAASSPPAGGDDAISE